MYSTLEDMARVASFVLCHQPSAGSVLAPSSLLESRRESVGRVGIGWQVANDPELGTLVWHNGSTLDYGAWLGILPTQDLAFVALLGTGDLDDIEEVAAVGRAGLAAMAGAR
jgi:CubicO group peptidase (beta-lactamase class C family)